MKHEHDQLVDTYAGWIAMQSVWNKKYAHADTIKSLYHNEQLRINNVKNMVRQQQEQAKIIQINGIHKDHLKFFQETGLNSDVFYRFTGDDQQNSLHKEMCDFLYNNHTHMTLGHDTINSPRDVAATLAQHHFLAAYILNTINQLPSAEQIFIIVQHLVMLAAGAAHGTIQGGISRGTDLITDPIGSASDFVHGLVMLPIAAGYYGSLMVGKCATLTAPFSMMADDNLCAEFFQHYTELHNAVFDRLPSFTVQQCIDWYNKGIFNHLNAGFIYARENVDIVAHPLGALLFDIIATHGCQKYRDIPCTIISLRLKKTLARIKANMPTVTAVINDIKDSGMLCKEFIGKKINALLEPNPMAYAKPAGLPNVSRMAIESDEIGATIQREISKGGATSAEIGAELAEVAEKVAAEASTTIEAAKVTAMEGTLRAEITDALITNTTPLNFANGVVQVIDGQIVSTQIIIAEEASTEIIARIHKWPKYISMEEYIALKNRKIKAFGNHIEHHIEHLIAQDITLKHKPLSGNINFKMNGLHSNHKNALESFYDCTLINKIDGVSGTYKADVIFNGKKIEKSFFPDSYSPWDILDSIEELLNSGITPNPAWNGFEVIGYTRGIKMQIVLNHELTKIITAYVL